MSDINEKDIQENLNYDITSKIQKGVITTNIEKIKKELWAQLKPYESYVVADETMVGEGKKVRAALNNIKNYINDRKKDVKREYLSPYTDFEYEVKDMLEKIAKVSGDIDLQIKIYEEQWRDDRRQDIEEWYDDNGLSAVAFEDFIEPQWLNKSTSDKKWQELAQNKVDKIESDLDALDSMGVANPTQLKLEYLNNDHDIPKALKIYNERMAKEKELALQREEKKIVFVVRFDLPREADEFERMCLDNGFDFKREN